jgi:periplasmic protein TonB
MKYLISNLLALLTILSAHAQIEQLAPPAPSPADTTGTQGAGSNDSIREFVGEQAVYKGGDAALFAFIAKNITYPGYELENEIEGLVMVEFVVEKDGTTSGHKVVRGVSGGLGLEKEALRVARLIQFEKPSMENNVPVRAYYSLPFRFKLD